MDVGYTWRIFECAVGSKLAGTFLNLPVQKVLNLNALGVNATEFPEISLVVYHDTIDAIVPVARALTLYDKWHAAGIKWFETFEDKTAGPYRGCYRTAVGCWLKDRFAGIEPVQAATKHPNTNLE